VTLADYGVDESLDPDGQADEREPARPTPDGGEDEHDGPVCADCESDSSLVTARDPYDVPLCATCYLDREGL
jgi:hypothetical protein